MALFWWSALYHCLCSGIVRESFSPNIGDQPPKHVGCYLKKCKNKIGDGQVPPLSQGRIRMVQKITVRSARRFGPLLIGTRGPKQRM